MHRGRAITLIECEREIASQGGSEIATNADDEYSVTLLRDAVLLCANEKVLRVQPVIPSSACMEGGKGIQTVSVPSSRIREGIHHVGEYRSAAVPGGEHASDILHDRDGRLQLPQHLRVFQIERLPFVVRRIVEGVAGVPGSSRHRVGLTGGTAEEARSCRRAWRESLQSAVGRRHSRRSCPASDTESRRKPPATHAGRGWPSRVREIPSRSENRSIPPEILTGIF